MMRRIASLAIFCACSFGAAVAAEPKPKRVPEGKAAAKPKRKAMPIGGEWNLSGATLEKAKMDGKRVVQLIAKGDAKLKRGRNPLTGPWIQEVSAEVIECDFPAKRFIIRAPFTITNKGDAGGSTEIRSKAEETTAMILFHSGEMRIEGPNHVVAKDARAAEEEAAAAAAQEK